VSGLAALATLLLLPAIAGGLGLSRGAASRAAWVLATSPIFLAYAQTGLLDATASACVTAAIAAKLARAKRDARARRRLAVLEGVALAAALLMKGPVLLLFPVGLRLGAALARERSAASADRSDALALGVALGIAGAWLLAATQAEGYRYAREIALRQAVRRISGHAPHLRPPGYLIAVTLIGLLPWTLLGAPLGRLWSALRRGTIERPSAAQAALLGWILLPALLLSLLATQQPHYLLPTLPALALLLSQAVAEPERWAIRCTAALGLLVGAALLARAAWALPMSSEPAELAMAHDPAVRMAALLAAALLFALLLLPRAARLPPWQRAAACAVVLATAAMVSLVRLDPWMSPRALVSNPAVQAASQLAAPSSARSSVRLFGKRTQVEARRKPELGAWLAADPRRVALVWERDLPRVGPATAQLEQIGRGYHRGKPLIALRAAPPAATPDPIR
jgi:4-amino-4-deoxy-L-arabinose transferase-like glycosyltransferase